MQPVVQLVIKNAIKIKFYPPHLIRVITDITKNFNEPTFIIPYA